VGLDVPFVAVPVEAMRAFLEPLGYRFDWGPELDGIGFHRFTWTEPVYEHQAGARPRR
jgi:hypothetical protein